MYVIYGRRRSITNIKLTELTPDQGFVLYGATDGDHIGISVNSAGDINNDGFDDIIFGATMQRNVGAAYVLYGKSKFGYSSLHLSRFTSSDGR